MIQKSAWKSGFRSAIGGFNLVELLMTLVILAILGAIATPAMTYLITLNRVSGQANDFVGAVNFARSEAVKRGQAVTMCKSSDGASCTGGSDWAVGWVICDDPTAAATCATLIRAHAALSDGSTAAVATTGMSPSLTFLPIGRPPPAFVPGQIQVCPSDTAYATNCRTVCINRQGRPRADTGTCD